MRKRETYEPTLYGFHCSHCGSGKANIRKFGSRSIDGLYARAPAEVRTEWKASMTRENDEWLCTPCFEVEEVREHKANWLWAHGQR